MEQTPRGARRPPSLSALSARSGAGMGLGGVPLSARGGMLLGMTTPAGRSEGMALPEHPLSSAGSLLSMPFKMEPPTPRDREVLTKAEKEARQRAQSYIARHQALEKDREVMDQRINERRLRNVQRRDSKFETLMAGIASGAGFKAEVGDAIRRHETQLQSRQQELYEQWDCEVAQRVEHQLVKRMSKELPKLPEGFREHLHRHDDPLKSAVHSLDKETKFHQSAELVLNCPSTAREDIRRREALAEQMANRETSRPVLPIDKWDQRQLYASRIGSFLQACNAQDEGAPGFFSTRRMGADAHRLDESDGMPVAGKTKHRHERNLLGMLDGNVAKEGESARFKTEHGAGSGAPGQDHYHFERGNSIVEVEFPLGKRCFPELIR
mmetsp:Transcript_153162/g.491147  ORF Transcript_153162/g.491147 Transcript_153162/m.491147 type:complete len:382 (-) Transcript_153162:117-1262(-)